MIRGNISMRNASLVTRAPAEQSPLGRVAASSVVQRVSDPLAIRKRTYIQASRLGLSGSPVRLAFRLHNCNAILHGKRRFSSFF